MEMDILPFGVPTMPHPRLFRLAAAWPALPIHILREADVGDAGGLLSNQVHVRVEDGGVDGLTVLRQQVFKVKSVEVHPLHQVSQGLRFKAGESRVADFSIGFKVTIVDGLNKLLSDFDDLLFA